MPTATLLLREKTSTSLNAIVERSQQKKPPLPEYEIRLNTTRIDFVLKSKPDRFIKLSATTTTTADEGFESDVDTLSIVSSDDSFTSTSKTPETDSANGSTSSDSDTETFKDQNEEDLRESYKETYDLVDCVCYTDVKLPNLLVFVIKSEALVFKFDRLDHLHNFYVNFSALKAVTNQKTYSKSVCAKFNLLQRTDQNGVTHIEITRERPPPPVSNLVGGVGNNESSNIISLNTPECRVVNKRDVSSRQRSVSSENLSIPPAPAVEVADLEGMFQNDRTLRKVWGSAEDLLDTSKSPERPQRKRKPKGKAPQPPVDVLKGQYVRVNVNSRPPEKNSLVIKINQKDPNLTNAYSSSSSGTKLTTYQQFKSEQTKTKEPSTLGRTRQKESWTNSLLRKPRSRSESRNFTPMAYRYIDTTQPRQQYLNAPAISNRLFGMSPKLKDFNTVEKQRKFDDRSRWNTLNTMGSLGSLGSLADGSLKSVIKKDDAKKKHNEKKVTFSAYTTVQVV